MRLEPQQYPVFGFLRYPWVGPEDVKYAFGSARVRALGILSVSIFQEMINAADYGRAAEVLSTTEYSQIASSKTTTEFEPTLLAKRAEVMDVFVHCIENQQLIAVFKSRYDFANFRLAVRRIVTGRGVGRGYSEIGNIAVNELTKALEEENYDHLPEYLREAIAQAILHYYDTKDIRQIDLVTSQMEMDFALEQTAGNHFCTELFRMLIDLGNIRTLLRLKNAQSEAKDEFIYGGYIEQSRLVHCLGLEYDGIDSLFFATPYYEVVMSGIDYLTKNRSFLMLEKLCDNHLLGFLRTTSEVTSGSQPIVAYLLRKEHEIRMLRMVLAGKKNSIDPGLLLDRLTEVL